MNVGTTTRASKQTGVKLRPEVKTRIEALSSARFGPRGLSRWIERQLDLLLKDRDFLARLTASAPAGELVRKTIVLTPESQKLLAKATVRVRKIDPTSEDVQSQILRAAFDLAIESEPAPEVEGRDPSVDIPIGDVKPRLGSTRARKR